MAGEREWRGGVRYFGLGHMGAIHVPFKGLAHRGRAGIRGDVRLDDEFGTC